MIENPDETLAFLLRLRSAIGGTKIRRVHIDHQQCDQTDLCASVLMDALLMAAQTHWRNTKRTVEIYGRLPPESSPVHKLLINSGVVANVVKNRNVPASLAAGVERFRLVKGGKNSPLESARKEIVSSRLAEYFDRCLRSTGYGLKLDAQGALSSIVSEVLDNAELHSNSDGRWFAIGHFDPNPSNSAAGTCNLVLFNFGDSIYQSLRRGDSSTALQGRLRQLSRAHEQTFLNPKGRFKESTLWTPYAIQEGVSRLSEKDGEVARGGGTVDMIEFFNELSAGDQRMAIVSGDALILNDGRFKPKKDNAGNTVIAFNEHNDLREPPDPSLVRALDHSFPGTLISLRFPFDKKHLDEQIVQGLNASHERGKYQDLVVYVDLQQANRSGTGKDK